MNEDFPAAHSMDSGWFAIDREGRVAHFDTGEAGAMPHDAAYATGEAGGDEAELLWLQHIAPWIARNVASAEIRNGTNELLALFDTIENVATAVEHGATRIDENELLVQPAQLPSVDELNDANADTTLAHELDGFVGYAPMMYEAFWEESLQRLLPLAFYQHDDWAIPGDYRRAELADGQFDAPAAIRDELTQMNTSFAQNRTIQLADFYENNDCVSWSRGDLRTGEVPPTIPRDSWLGRVLRFFGGS